MKKGQGYWGQPGRGLGHVRDSGWARVVTVEMESYGKIRETGNEIDRTCWMHKGERREGRHSDGITVLDWIGTPSLVDKTGWCSKA